MLTTTGRLPPRRWRAAPRGFDIEGSLGATTLAGTITLTVTGANDAPSAAITAPATAEVGTSVNLVGSASADPDSGDSIASHAWTFTGSDGGDGTLGNAALADTSFTPSAAGTVVLTLTVTDSATPPATGTALHTLTVSEVVPTTIGPAAALAGAVTEAGATDTTGLPTASGALMLLDADSTEVPGGSYAFATQRHRALRRPHPQRQRHLVVHARQRGAGHRGAGGRRRGEGHLRY